MSFSPTPPSMETKIMNHRILNKKITIKNELVGLVKFFTINYKTVNLICLSINHKDLFSYCLNKTTSNIIDKVEPNLKKSPLNLILPDLRFLQ